MGLVVNIWLGLTGLPHINITNAAQAILLYYHSLSPTMLNINKYKSNLHILASS